MGLTMKESSIIIYVLTKGQKDTAEALEELRRALAKIGRIANETH